MSFLTLADVKAQLNITTTANDAELQTFVDAAIAVVERLAGVVDPRAITEVAHCRGGRSLMLMTRPVLSVTSSALLMMGGCSSGPAREGQYGLPTPGGPPSPPGTSCKHRIT